MWQQGGRPYRKNDNIAKFNENNLKKKKAKKKTLIVVISVLLVVLLAGGAASYFFYFEPNARYTEAVDLYNKGKYEEASVMFVELGNFKDSADRVVQCDTAIKQAKYDKAIKKAKNYKYGEAIAMLTELGDFSDSKAKIKELEEEYFGLLQQLYAYVYRGYDTDILLAECVRNTLELSDLYDASDSTAMSYLYSGSSYRVYYYWSRYYNGYAYVVTSDAAEAFVSLLALTDKNITEITQLRQKMIDPPAKYKDLHDQIISLCSDYAAFHKFVSEKPSMNYSLYEGYMEAYQKSVDKAISATKTENIKIVDQVATYAWFDKD